MDSFSDVPKHLLARLFYCNPVCLLTSGSAAPNENAMTISWLTCADNSGTLLLSMNHKRSSHQNMREGAHFTLNIVNAAAAETLRRVGRSHGGNKGLQLDADGRWENEAVVAVARCVVARLEAEMVPGHSVLVAEIASAAIIRAEYWVDNKKLLAGEGMEPLLTFAGSGQFGGMHALK